MDRYVWHYLVWYCVIVIWGVAFYMGPRSIFGPHSIWGLFSVACLLSSLDSDHVVLTLHFRLCDGFWRGSLQLKLLGVYKRRLWGAPGPFLPLLLVLVTLLFLSFVRHSSWPHGSSPAVMWARKLRCCWRCWFLLLVEGESYSHTLKVGSLRLELVIG